jgi:hypothetical protein
MENNESIKKIGLKVSLHTNFGVVVPRGQFGQPDPAWLGPTRLSNWTTVLGIGEF